MNTKQRTSIFLDPEEYKKLKIKLILKGITFSQWLNERIKEELNK